MLASEAGSAALSLHLCLGVRRLKHFLHVGVSIPLSRFSLQACLSCASRRSAASTRLCGEFRTYKCERRWLSSHFFPWNSREQYSHLCVALVLFTVSVKDA